MKAIIKESFREFITDRYLVILSIVMVLLALISAIIIMLSIHPSESQLVSRYSTFGITHFYRNQWYYLFVFAAFNFVVAALHSVIAIKLLVVRGHSVAIMFVWFGIGIILLNWVAALAVINVLR